jgi:tRNA (guanine37-N1)-methyltransferase
MIIDILTLFPEMFRGPLDDSIIGKARDRDLVRIKVHNIRDYTHDKHRTADDRPFGGGPGMVMKPEPIFECLEAIGAEKAHVIHLTPQGKRFDQMRARELAGFERIVFLCGHYEGIDERVVEALVDEELSIGDYVLTNGALAAMVVTDAVVRLIPGVLGHDESAVLDSFTDNLLDYPHYTRPEVYRGMKTPQVLLSGDHQRVERWRKERAIEKTKKVRPDLLEGKNKNETTT